MTSSRSYATAAGVVVACALALTAARAHPGSGIAADAQGNVHFVDTGQGVWKLDASGKLTLIHRVAYHWMALDGRGSFAESNSLGEFDGGSFERATPAGAKPTLIISSDYPIAVGEDGGLYYVPFARQGARKLVRRTPSGQRSVVATLPIDTGPEPMGWVNGIATGPEGVLYVTDHDAIRKIDRSGTVSTFREGIEAPDCPDPLPDAPKLPYLRGLALAPDGSMIAAANGCRTVIAIPAKGAIKTLLKAERPWSPTDVALSGKDVYVLEYLHTGGEDRKQWLPRVRKIGADGTITTLASVERQKN